MNFEFEVSTVGIPYSDLRYEPIWCGTLRSVAWMGNELAKHRAAFVDPMPLNSMLPAEGLDAQDEWTEVRQIPLNNFRWLAETYRKLTYLGSGGGESWYTS